MAINSRKTKEINATEARRKRVSELMLGGMVVQSQIAKTLGVCDATVHRDVKAVKEQWKQQISHDQGVFHARAILRIQALIAALWPKAMAGDLGAVGKIIELMAREAKVIGYDASEKVDHTVSIKIAAQQIADQLGLDVGDVLAEANRIIEASQQQVPA